MRSLALTLLLVVPAALQASQEGPGLPYEAARLAMRAAGVEDGLPNPRVHCTFRDSRGRLWVGTQEGVAFLGGTGWTYFPLPKEAPSVYIRAMAETSDGALWFGTEAGGLWRHLHGEWSHWTEGRGLPVARVNVLLADGLTLWVGTGGGGLLKGQDGQFAAVAGPTEPWIWSIAALPDVEGKRRIWVGGERQVWFQEGDGWRRLGEREGFWNAGANAMAARRRPDGGIEIWLSAWTLGVGRLDLTSQRFEGPLAGNPSRSPTSLAVVPGDDGFQEVWVGTYDAGIARYTAGGWDILGPSRGFPSSGVYALLVNPDGRPALWAGTRGAGLVSIDPSGWRTIPPDPRLPSTQANCFLETADGRGGRTLWIGTDRGLVRWNSRGIVVDTVTSGLPADFVTDIREFPGRAGPEVWVATLGGVVRQRGTRWESAPGWEALSLYRVQSLEADPLPGGGLRVYAGGDGGLAVLDGGRWRLVEGGQSLPRNAIVTSLLRAVDPDGTSSLWVGMRGGGVARLKNGTWRRFGIQEGLPNASVYGLALSQTPGGRRWLWATMVGGGGLARLDMDRPDEGFRSWTQAELSGVPTQGIQRVVVSPQGAMYLTTSRGVVRMDVQGPDWEPWRVTTFRTSDGLPSAASEAGAAYIDMEGRVWVGTARGVAVLDPLGERQVPPPGPPIIEQVLVQGRPVDPDAAAAHRRDHEPAGAPLPPGARRCGRPEPRSRLPAARHGPLQVGERHLGTPGRRPGAAPGGGCRARRRSRGGSRGPLGRRGVPHHRAGHAGGRTAGAGRARPRTPGEPPLRHRRGPAHHAHRVDRVRGHAVAGRPTRGLQLGAACLPGRPGALPGQGQRAQPVGRAVA